MKVTNAGVRPIMAAINPSNSDNREDLEWFEIPAGESIDVENYKVASTLIEHGATADPTELSAARALWAENNRRQNSQVASAAASEGEILARQQATVDVATGTVAGGEGEGDGLKGKALEEAVKAANEAGAGIPSSASAGNKRKALAEWQASRGTSTSLEDSGRYVVTADEDLYLDDDGQPVELALVEVDEDGRAVFVDGRPVLKATTTADETIPGPTA